MHWTNQSSSGILLVLHPSGSGLGPGMRLRLLWCYHFVVDNLPLYIVSLIFSGCIIGVCYDRSGSPDRLLSVSALFKQKRKASGAQFDHDRIEDDRGGLMTLSSQKRGLEAVFQALLMIRW